MIKWKDGKILMSTLSSFILQRSSMKVGDFVVGVGTIDTKWAKHEEVVQYVRTAGNYLELRLITPMGPSYLEVSAEVRASTISLPTSPVKLQNGRTGSLTSEKSNRSRLSAPWIFMRRNSSKEKTEKKKPEEGDDDIISR